MTSSTLKRSELLNTPLIPDARIASFFFFFHNTNKVTMKRGEGWEEKKVRSEGHTKQWDTKKGKEKKRKEGRRDSERKKTFSFVIFIIKEEVVHGI